MMIERALLKRILIDRFIENSIFDADRNKHVLIEDRLTDEDWKTLSETYTILKPFYS